MKVHVVLHNGHWNLVLPNQQVSLYVFTVLRKKMFSFLCSSQLNHDYFSSENNNSAGVVAVHFIHRLQRYFRPVFPSHYRPLHYIITALFFLFAFQNDSIHLKNGMCVLFISSLKDNASTKGTTNGKHISEKHTQMLFAGQ